MLGSGCLQDQNPIKNTDIESLMSFSGCQYLKCDVTTLAGGITCIPFDSTGRKFWKSVPFPFAGFVLYLFAIINCTIC